MTREERTTHDSDCALHNAPALPVGSCDCSVRTPPIGAVLTAENYCDACQAFPRYGHCNLKGCPRAPSHAQEPSVPAGEGEDTFCGEGWVFWDDDGEEYSLDHPDARGSSVERLRRSTPQEDHLYTLWQASLPAPVQADSTEGVGA